MCCDGVDAAYLDGLVIEAEAILLISEELLDLGTLITLELDHLAHLGVTDDGAIASELFLDNLKNLLVVELARNTLNGGQSLTSITLCDNVSTCLVVGELTRGWQLKARTT